MEIKFNADRCRYLRQVTDQTQTREQTQEVRLPEAMPDIGRVLGAWGRVMVRSKEWHSGGMGISGGVMAWVLYVPEGEENIQSVECWIPFQMKWEFPQTQTDGVILAEPALAGIDARSLSPRKLLVRANVSLRGLGLERTEAEIFTGGTVPEDIQLLTNTYPLALPWESGEKLMQMDDDVSVSGDAAPVETVLRYDLIPVLQEQRILASRVVFRGEGMLHILYRSGDGIYTLDAKVPFSQFIELEQDHGTGAQIQLIPVLTNLELEKGEERLRVKASMAVQYMVYDRYMAALTEDAYSPQRLVSLQQETLQLPVLLDKRQETVTVHKPIHTQAQRVLDTDCRLDCVRRQSQGRDTALVINGGVQVLFKDNNGSFQCASARFEELLSVPADPEAELDAIPEGAVTASAEPEGEAVNVALSVPMTVSARCRQELPMVTGLTLGEEIQPDPMAPSLILRRAGTESLWTLAKSCGSTVEAIAKANQLEGEPEKGRMLLIPVC